MNKAILIVEGEDEKDIACALANKHNITTTWPDKNKDDQFDVMADIRILVKDRPNIRKAILDAASDQYAQQIGVIYDSEEKPSETAAELESFRAITTTVRPEIQYHILQLPSSSEIGSLEKICLGTIDANDPLLLCSDAFIDCVSQHDNKLTTTARKDKARFIAWYAAKTGKPIGRLGLDARGEKILDLSHAAFDPIVLFLKQLASHV
jgi:hypothetical protein